MVIRVPKTTKPGSSSSGLIELVDLYPTLAELCDVQPPDDLQGQSLVPMLTNPKSPGKEAVYTVVRRGPKLGKAIRTQRWRYASWPDGEELYDLDSDIAEHHNLAHSAEHRSVLTAMRHHLTQAESHAESAKK